MAKKKQKEDTDGMSIEDVLAPGSEEEQAHAIKTNRLVSIAQQQMMTSVRYKEPRMQDVAKSEDLYFGRTKPALKGRWNIPLPIMSGYVDTLLSKIDDAPKIKYGYQDIADMRRAQKVQAKWDQDSSAVEGKWSAKDRLEKKLASFYGVGINKIFAYNDEEGKYCSHYEVIDPLDFECEPLGGQDLSMHSFKGQRNIFKTRSDLIRGCGGKNPMYNRKGVLRLIAVTGSDDYKKFQKVYQEKTDRLKALGFNPEGHSYMGVPTFNLTEWYMQDPETGEKWYLFFEPHSGIAVRSCPLKDIFESDTDPFDAWHTHPESFNFWSKAPADDMRPVAEGMHVIFNQALDNREKKNYGQRAYDPAVFSDPSQLEWRPDGLVEVESGISSSQGIGSGIHEFTIPDMPEGGTINLLEFMDRVVGLKTGITAGAQGEDDENKVGIYFGNLQQVADRLGLYNKSYSECWGRKGLKYYWGLREHIKSNNLMVRMIGVSGYNWVEMVKSDTEPRQELNIEIVGGQAQSKLDEVLKQTKRESLLAVTSSPTLVARLNPDVLIEEVLTNGGWEAGQIRRLMDTQAYGSEELVSEAHEAMQDILEGKVPKPNRGATTTYVQTIIDFAYDSEDLEQDMFERLIAFAQAHISIATENMMRRVRMATAIQGAGAVTNAQGTPTVPTTGGGGAGPTPEVSIDSGAAEQAILAGNTVA